MKKNFIISTKPFIQLLSNQLQEDCLTTRYYLPHFLENQDKLTEIGSLKLLEDYCLKITDGLHYKPTYIDEEGTLFISAKDISSSSFNFSNALRITQEDHLNNMRCVPQPRDILLSKVGTIGKAVVVPDNTPEFNIYVSVALLKLKNKDDAQFITLFLNSDLAFLQMDRVVKGIGTPDLHLSDIKGILVPEISADSKKTILARYELIFQAASQIAAKANELKLTLTRIRELIDIVFEQEFRIVKELEKNTYSTQFQKNL